MALTKYHIMMLQRHPVVHLPSGHPCYRPPHLTPPELGPDGPRGRDPVRHLPEPQLIPSLPIITDSVMYQRAFTMPWVHMDDCERLDVDGDKAYRGMIQSILYDEFAHLLFDSQNIKIIHNRMCSVDQAAYFAYIYDFDSRLAPKGTLSTYEKQKYLGSTFFAFVGAVDENRGVEVLKKWIKKLTFPILEELDRELTVDWSDEYREAAVKESKVRLRRKEIPPELEIPKQSYEWEDYEWMAIPSNWLMYGEDANDVCDALLKTLRRRLRTLTSTPDLDVSVNRWFSHHTFRWNCRITVCDKTFGSCNEFRRVAEFNAAWRTVLWLLEFHEKHTL
ncbi:hypothetical protein ABW19_dt0201129 [Dactylella cylindrospora]|nr:hypothetical protein ABW19_dt0201129 [Dactylella cylindrospora]